MSHKSQSFLQKAKHLFAKRKNQLLPTLLLLIATTIIVIVGSSFYNTGRRQKQLKAETWKIKTGIFIPIEITSFSPQQGPTSGNTTLTIVGQGLTKDAKIYLGSKISINQRAYPLELKTINKQGTKATTTLPPHPAGTVDIYAIYNGNYIGPTEQFTYQGGPVTSKTAVQIDSVNPETLSIKTKNDILISGHGFAPANTIKFGNGIIDNVKSSDGKTIKLHMPTNLQTAVGSIPIVQGKYDLSIIANNQESNLITLNITQ